MSAWVRRGSASGVARAVMFVLALALTLSNAAAGTMPPPRAHQDSAATAHTQPHCASAAHAAPHMHVGDGSCCSGHACACAQVFHAVAMPVCALAGMALSSQPCSTIATRIYATIAASPLRPPIA